MKKRIGTCPASPRRGGVLVLAAASLVLALAFAAFSVDVGYIALTRTQLQRAADGAALAAALELPDGWGLGATVSADRVAAAGRDAAVSVAASHRAGDRRSTFADGPRDVRFGQRVWVPATGSWQKLWGVAPYNMVEVTLRRIPDDGGDGALPLFFAPVIGHKTANVTVRAAAGLVPGGGFRLVPGSPRQPMVLPFAFDELSWELMTAGAGSDRYYWDPETGQFGSGSDGVPEVDLYPDGNSSLPSGNRGIINLGAPSSGTGHVERQILEGLSESDLSHFGGELRTDDGPITVTGTTGLRSSLETPLLEIRGQERALPLFRSFSDQGNNATFTIVRFVGVRVLDANLTGNQKYVIVQPTPFIDATVIPADGPILQDSILAPVALVE